jgi:hypothetical protein
MAIIRRESRSLTSRRMIGCLIAFAVLDLLYRLLPREYQLPYEWDIPVFVALAWSSLLLLLWPPLWKQLKFWIALAVAMAVQIGAMEEWLHSGHSAWATGRNFGFLGIFVCAVSYYALWRMFGSHVSARDDLASRVALRV